MKFNEPILLKEILGLISSPITWVGDAASLVTGINEIHSVEERNISFVDSPKYYDKVLNSVAGTIIINKEMEAPVGKNLIITDDPLKVYIEITKKFIHFTPQTEMIHPSAKIGAGTIIQPGTFIGENVVIGEKCIIHSNVSIYADSIIGNNTIIHSGSVIGADAFYFQRRPELWLKLESCGRTIIGNDVEVGSGVYVDRGVSGETRIGDGTKIDNIVQIGHDTQVGQRCLVGSQVAIAGCTFVDDDCLIWAKCSINKDLYIAKGTTLLALTAVDKSIETPNQTFFGTPAGNPLEKWREMAYVRQLPEVMREYEKLKKELNGLIKKMKEQPV
ncbi:MAG: UDP-3-O-(3-hydroxymyristoyl)glucosamine N-acyltransferase [Bacteroidales bacterium]|jgi:UDP-3-O-[3-hydroxymyristoyl] glucosamine N-acyltransferase|nr:UDP-3-O-(3-hydroxymyristoyl)glucosamine N-acyltransferase [Bacteroidales bacterium]